MNLVDFFTSGAIGGAILSAVFFAAAIAMAWTGRRSSDNETSSRCYWVAVLAGLCFVPVFVYCIFNAGSLVVLSRTPQGRAIVKLNEFIG